MTAEEMKHNLQVIYSITPYSQYVNFSTNNNCVIIDINNKNKIEIISAYVNAIRKSYPEINFIINNTDKDNQLGESQCNQKNMMY